MSGRRVKALVRAFEAQHGRPPQPDGGVPIFRHVAGDLYEQIGEVSERRRLKRHGLSLGIDRRAA